MYLRVRIHRWALWWFYVGVVVGAVALINILFRDLTRRQEEFILAVGAMNWVLGGVVCYCLGGIRIENPSGPAKADNLPAGTAQGSPQKEWHSASEFVLPGRRNSLLTPKY
jgi:hypothetical protein